MLFYLINNALAMCRFTKYFSNGDTRAVPSEPTGVALVKYNVQYLVWYPFSDFHLYKKQIKLRERDELIKRTSEFIWAIWRDTRRLPASTKQSVWSLTSIFWYPYLELRFLEIINKLLVFTHYTHNSLISNKSISNIILQY